MAAPGSRLSDDLYSLYLAMIGWFLLPLYGAGLAVVLPSNVSGFGRARDLTVVVAVAGSAWIGYRGGPFLINRAGVLHELGSPRRLRDSMLPRLLRQAVAYGALTAIAVTVLLALSDADTFGFGEAGASSVVVAIAMMCSVFSAVGWLVVFKGAPRHPRLIVAANVIVALSITALVAAGESLWSAAGVAVLGAGFAISGGVAILSLDDIPVEHLWRRASALEDMRSAMLSFDFQQVLVSLRRAVDHTEGRKRANLARRWMPTHLWRYLASIESGWLARVGQFLVAGVGAALLVALADPADGVTALAIAAIGFVVGIELASPVAATTGQIVFLVHYPQSSATILRRQTLTAVMLSLVLGLASIGWRIIEDLPTGLGVVGIFSFGTLAAATQGRLGSPDLSKLASVLGPTGIGPALWARAMLGPLLIVAFTIVVSHGWLHPDELNAPWGSATAVLVIVAALIATFPLEKR